MADHNNPFMKRATADQQAQPCNHSAIVFLNEKVDVQNLATNEL